MNKCLLGRNYVTFEQYVTEYVKKVSIVKLTFLLYNILYLIDVCRLLQLCVTLR